MSVRDARVYTCTVHDNLSCTGLQNYTIGASPMSVSVSVSVSVQWNSSFTTLKWVEEDIQRQQSTVVYTRRNWQLDGWVQAIAADTMITDQPTLQTDRRQWRFEDRFHSRIDDDDDSDHRMLRFHPSHAMSIVLGLVHIELLLLLLVLSLSAFVTANNRPMSTARN